MADLNSTCGRPVRACLRNAWLRQRARRGELAVGHHDLDALVAQDAEPAARGLLGRVVGGDDDARELGLEDRVGARRRLARGGSTARARRRASRRPGRRRRRRRAPRRSACAAAVGGVPALPQRPAVADDHGAHQRVGAASGPRPCSASSIARASGAWSVCRSVVTGQEDISPAAARRRRATGRSRSPALGGRTTAGRS